MKTIDQLKKEAAYEARVNLDRSGMSAEERLERMIKAQKAKVDADKNKEEAIDNAARAAIKTGKWNGKIYGGTIYVNGKKYPVSKNFSETKITYHEAFEKHGFDFAEEGNY